MTRSRLATALGLLAAYAALAVALTWPLVLDLGGSLVGVADTDTADTAWLHLAVATSLPSLHTPLVFAPTGLELPTVVPNLVHYLAAAPLVGLLPFPLADNLFALLVIIANGLAGHAVGRGLGGSHRAGLLCGVALASAEPVVRELALGHAPQGMVAAAALAVLAATKALELRSAPWALGAGALIGLAALTYWFQGLFLVVLGLPVAVRALLRDRRCLRELALIGGAALAVAIGPLIWTLLQASELASVDPSTISMPSDPRLAAVDPAQRLAASHGNDPLWFLRSWPAHLSSRLSVAVLGAAVVGTWKLGRSAWPWWVAIGLGGIMLMGPVLQWGGTVLTLGDGAIPLPGGLLGFGPLARLHWPERWALVVVLALLPLLARARRPEVWAGLVLVESLVLSSNLPLPTWDVRGWSGWSDLAAARRPVLVVPLAESVQDEARGDEVRSSHALGLRFARVPLVNGANLPPGAPVPEGWTEARGATVDWAISLCAGGEAESVDRSVLRADGLAAVVLDVSPGGPTTSSDRQLYEQALTATLGPPRDHGSLLVWWTEPESAPVGRVDGASWRERLASELEGPRRRPALCTQRGRMRP